VLLPHAALQLPPGCIPPPAAFFLVEQLLRGAPSAAALDMAIKLLSGTVGLVGDAGQQQQQQQQEGSSSAENEPAGAAELQRLAYCSLASSVVQACLHDKQLGAGAVQQLLSLAAEMTQAAASAAAVEHGSSSSNHISSSSSSSSGSVWGLAASLAAKVAAGAYWIHVMGIKQHGAPAYGIKLEAGSSSGRCSNPGTIMATTAADTCCCRGTAAEAGNSDSTAAGGSDRSGSAAQDRASSAAEYSSSSSSSSTAPEGGSGSAAEGAVGSAADHGSNAAADVVRISSAAPEDATQSAAGDGSSSTAGGGSGLAADGSAGASPCPVGCSVCASTGRIVGKLVSLDMGAVPPEEPLMGWQVVVARPVV
jgi:hypothetical protein